jgi:hypothetical protein
MAKSVLDWGWGKRKNLLEYKSQQAARTFEVVRRVIRAALRPDSASRLPGDTPQRPAPQNSAAPPPR